MTDESKMQVKNKTVQKDLTKLWTMYIKHFFASAVTLELRIAFKDKEDKGVTLHCGHCKEIHYSRNVIG